MFGEDYLKFKHFLDIEGTPVYITGTYQPRYNSEDEFEVKINQIQLLKTCGEEKAKKITVHVPLSDLDQKLLQSLNELCITYPGKYALGVRLRDENTRNTVEFSSMKYRVDISNELVPQAARGVETGVFIDLTGHRICLIHTWESILESFRDLTRNQWHGSHQYWDSLRAYLLSIDFGTWFGPWNFPPIFAFVMIRSLFND